MTDTESPVITDKVSNLVVLNKTYWIKVGGTSLEVELTRFNDDIPIVPKIGQDVSWYYIGGHGHVQWMHRFKRSEFSLKDSLLTGDGVVSRCTKIVKVGVSKPSVFRRVKELYERHELSLSRFVVFSWCVVMMSLAIACVIKLVMAAGFGH